jgi:hypothetical protein
VTLGEVLFPAVVRATPAGWIVQARSIEDLETMAMPFDPLYWKGMEIFDSSGRYFLAQNVILSADGKPDAELRESTDFVLEELQHQLALLAVLEKRYDRRVRVYEARDLRTPIRALFYD